MAEGLTKGVKNALAKRDHHSLCKDCGFALPKYPGRYPKCCPSCGTEREVAEAEQAVMLENYRVGMQMVHEGASCVVVEVDEGVAYAETPEGEIVEIRE